jgi:formylglycine-generating enzyme required for sulfatase activity
LVFSREGGLARVNAPTGTLIAYATKPGDVASDGDGRNGLYTSALLKQMRVKNVDVTKMLQNVRADVLQKSGNKQVPFDESSLVGDFYFAGKSGGAISDIKPQPEPVKTGGIEGERAFWESIKDSTDAEDFRFYLKEYSQGVFAPVAKNKLRKLSKVTTPTEINKKTPTNTGNTNSSTEAGNRPSGLASLATPAKTALAWYNALKNKDMEGLKRVFSKEGLAFLTASGKESGATLEDALKAGMNEPLPATVELRNEKIKGNYATMEGLAADGTWESGQFVKEDNEWKITIPSGSIVKNSLGMSFAYIPPGTFQMGSNNGYAGADEQPIHEVSISRGYFMGIHEVTQEQWQKVLGNNPSGFQNCGQCPVEQVSWEDAQDYIKRLNSQTNDGSRYRLPTEAEWEYAARAGTTGDYAGDLKAMGWYDKNSKKKTHEVGTKQPNGWGLYDMHGNVWEWVEDWYGTYPSGSVTDPTGPTSGSDRVLRGGSYGDVDYNVRQAIRYPSLPGRRNPILGFRLVRTLD